jgi:hypothetical protein
MKVTRRSFLIGLSGTAAGLLPLIGCRGQREKRLLALVRTGEAASVLGDHYIEARPEEGTQERLLRLLADDVNPCLRCDEEQLRRLVDEKIRQEFANGTTVEVDGWILSRSEARLLALSSLSRVKNPG